MIWGSGFKKQGLKTGLKTPSYSNRVFETGFLKQGFGNKEKGRVRRVIAFCMCEHASAIHSALALIP